MIMERNVLRAIEEGAETPFYYYDMNVLKATLWAVKRACAEHPEFVVHYAIKANSNPRIVQEIANFGFGADCVSGGELRLAMDCGIPVDKIVFSGVGKTDKELRLAIDSGIYSINVESLEELEVIGQIASELGKKANVSLRVNPDVGSDTHSYLQTGLAENKFGLSLLQIRKAMPIIAGMPDVRFRGLQFHIGSQILDMKDFKELRKRVNDIVGDLTTEGADIEMIDVGGGLGVDYDNPEQNSIPDFDAYFKVFAKRIKLSPGQTLHFELGRSIVAQCGSLISRVVYVKQGHYRQYVILDAGMNDLIRPALYHARHKIVNLTSNLQENSYDVVGPICESADVFGEDVKLPITKRGDIIAILSAGAYGEVMSSNYNSRPQAGTVFSN